MEQDLRTLLMRWEHDSDDAPAAETLEEMDRLEDSHQQWLSATNELEQAYYKLMESIR